MLRDMPIRRKLTFISMAATGMALVLAITIFMVVEYRQFREGLVRDLAATAGVLADNSSAALAFDYPDSAQLTLESLRAKPHVLGGAIYDRNGRVFAAYAPDAGDGAAAFEPPPLQPDGWQFGPNQLEVFHSVRFGEERLGSVMIRSSLQGMQERLWRQIYITAVVLVVASLAAFLLALRLQRGVVRPMAQLTAVMEDVARTKDYSRRAVKHGADELGRLVDGFNGMLEQLQVRDAALSGKNVELERAIKAKDMFLANMSHELRTPLNAIIGFTGALLMKLPGTLNPAQEEQLGIVQDSARHLLSLINDLLDLSKIESGNFQPTLETVSCRQVLEETCATLRPLAEQKQLALSIQAPPEEIAIVTDRRALRQIVLKLCNNAIKFTPAGSVTVAVAPTPDGQVEISVVDTGIGVSKAFQDKLFEAFSQMDSSHREGTGLGLHLSQRLARLIGGRIGFRSEPGQGSRFWVTLPREHRPATSPQS